MGRVTTIPKKPGPKSSKAKSRKEALDEARQALQELQGQDGNTGDYSVEHCSRMAKYWGAQFLVADEKLEAAKDPIERAQWMNLVGKASQEAGEWEKRKAGAMASLKADLLVEVLRRLNEQDELASELADIEE